jgi:hypothetical protein
MIESLGTVVLFACWLVMGSVLVKFTTSVLELAQEENLIGVKLWVSVLLTTVWVVMALPFMLVLKRLSVLLV